MKTALIHRYDNKPDILAVKENGCSEVYRRSRTDNFDLIVVVPTMAAKTSLAVYGVFAAALLLMHGSQKLFGFPPFDGAMPPLLSKMGLLGVIEFFGSALVVASIFTRPPLFCSPLRWRPTPSRCTHL